MENNDFKVTLWRGGPICSASEASERQSGQGWENNDFKVILWRSGADVFGCEVPRT